MFWEQVVRMAPRGLNQPQKSGKTLRNAGSLTKVTELNEEEEEEETTRNR